MRRWPVLEPLRIGCVRYLNAVPLIHGYTGAIVFEHPAALARDLAHGGLDVALVPIYEALGERRYLLVDDVAIASRGAVFSVFLAYRGKLQDIRRVVVDPASLTSVYLLKIVLAEFNDLRPVFIDPGPRWRRGPRRRCPGPRRRCTGQAAAGEWASQVAARILGEQAGDGVGRAPRRRRGQAGDGVGRAQTPEPADAILLIGNQAIDFRLAQNQSHQFLDLGAEWLRGTGLPFVYAAWMLPPELSETAAVADALRALKRHGLESLEDIVAGERFHNAHFRARYLREHIHYDLGTSEKEGIEKFRELLVKHGLAPAGNRALEYI